MKNNYLDFIQVGKYIMDSSNDFLTKKGFILGLLDQLYNLGEVAKESCENREVVIDLNLTEIL